MLYIAVFFNVDVGYLIGETDSKLFDINEVLGTQKDETSVRMARLSPFGPENLRLRNE